MLNIQTFLQQYVISQLGRTLAIAGIVITFLLIFNHLYIKKRISLYLAFITLLPLGLSSIPFFFSPVLHITTGGLQTVALVWLPFLVNTFFIIASLNKEARIITDTKNPEFLLRKELLRDTAIQDIVLVITIAPLYAVLPFSYYITLLIGAGIAIVSMWASYYMLIRKI